MTNAFVWFCILHITVCLLIGEYIGSKRKIGYLWSFLACFFFSPIIGLTITLLSKKLTSSMTQTTSVKVAEIQDNSVN